MATRIAAQGELALLASEPSTPPVRSAALPRPEPLAALAILSIREARPRRRRLRRHATCRVTIKPITRRMRAPPGALSGERKPFWVQVDGVGGAAEARKPAVDVGHLTSEAGRTNSRHGIHIRGT